MNITESDVALWLIDRARKGLTGTVDMGALERIVEQVSRESRRRALESLVRETVAEQPLLCPTCGGKLNVEAYERERCVTSDVGPVTFARDYGFCVPCGTHADPADSRRGLHSRAPASPRVQEPAALHALRGPTAQHAQDFQRLTGLALAPSTVHREARRQGERAQALRDADAGLTQSAEGIAQLASRAASPNGTYTLVIEIDAWNIRERDDWGRSEALRKRGEDPKRWHWVYTATIFRLDQRGTTASGRPVISERRFIATRMGLDAFRQQLYAEALLCGLSQAEHVLIVADGAV